MSLQNVFTKQDIQMLINRNSGRLQFIPSKGCSIAWQRFDKIMLDNVLVDYAICKACRQAITFRKKDGTSGLLNHICKQSFVIKPTNPATEEKLNAGYLKLVNDSNVHNASNNKKRERLNKRPALDSSQLTERPSPYKPPNTCSMTFDDYRIFGEYVASELRSLKSETNRRLLKRRIQECILEISDKDELAWRQLSLTDGLAGEADVSLAGKSMDEDDRMTLTRNTSNVTHTSDGSPGMFVKCEPESD